MSDRASKINQVQWTCHRHESGDFDLHAECSDGPWRFGRIGSEAAAREIVELHNARLSTMACRNCRFWVDDICKLAENFSDQIWMENLGGNEGAEVHTHPDFYCKAFERKL